MGGMLLEGQAAIVTGGGRGIGQAIALRLAGEGADVGVLDVDGDTAAVTAERVGSLGRRGIARRVDVRDHGAVTKSVEELAAEFGRIDVLVNNAGIEARAPFLDITPEEWDRQIAVNLTGTFNMMRLCAADMQNLSPFADGERGVIV